MEEYLAFIGCSDIGKYFQPLIYLLCLLFSYNLVMQASYKDFHQKLHYLGYKIILLLIEKLEIQQNKKKKLSTTNPADG